MAAVYYHTDRFPPDDRLDWPRLVPFIGPATAAVARYDGMLAAIPNPGVLLAPLTTREAVLSSRIEGTQATMGLDWVFERPIFRSTDFVVTADLPELTARRILKLLIDGGILKVLRSGRGRRPGVFCFSDLLDIAEGRRTPRPSLMTHMLFVAHLQDKMTDKRC